MSYTFFAQMESKCQNPSSLMWRHCCVLFIFCQRFTDGTWFSFWCVPAWVCKKNCCGWVHFWFCFLLLLKIQAEVLSRIWKLNFGKKICFNYYMFCSFHCSVTWVFRSWMCCLDSAEDRGQDTECLFIV